MKKILVIEDESEMRRNLLTILKLEKYKAVGAENGRVGLELARREKPDLIICDVMMPEMDGHAVVRAVREDPQLMTTPFIFLTAKGERADQRGGMECGADDYLIKPATRAELLGAITARLRRHEQQLRPEFKPNFESSEPLLSLGLTPRAAEALLWVAQGKTNAEIGTILGISESTVKKHLIEILEKLGVETRGAAALQALEILSSPRAKGGSQ